MKAIVVSDTHQNTDAIKSIVDYAKANGITTVFDAGDLHGCIRSYEGIDLHAVYWKEASGRMGWGEFSRDIRSINGTVHENGSGLRLENMLVFMQHNLADYESEIPQERLDNANQWLDSLAKENPDEALKRFIFFGHTHRIHYNNDGKSLAVNPGHTGDKETFAVIDSEDKSVEFRTKDKLLLRVDKDSDFVHVRDFNVDTGDSILRLKNQREVFQYSDNGQVKRSEEFTKIYQAFNSEHGLKLKVGHEDSTQQLIIGNFRSKRFNKIGMFETGYDKESPDYGKLRFYVGSIDVDGLEKEILVIGQDEKESIPFDRIKTNKISITGEKTIFVGQTRIGEKRHENPEHDDYQDHIVVDNIIRATYKSIDDILARDDKIVLTARDEKGKSLVSVINKDGSFSEGKKYNYIGDANYKDKKLVNGKLVYVAKDNAQMFVVIDGIEQTKHQIDPRNSWGDNLKDVQFIGDKLTYIVEREQSHSVFFEGKEITPIKVKKYSYDQGISHLTDFNGKPAYLTRTNENYTKIFVEDKIVVEADGITGFSIIGGQLVYQIGGRYGEKGECFLQNGEKLEGYQQLDLVSRAYSEGKLKLDRGIR